MSSPYPILDNRPIDQWKVTELKEELKRRRLMTKGLKEDLVKRLDEALRNEMENDKEDDDNGFNCEPQPEVPDMDVENVPIITETANDLVDHGDNKYEKVGDDMDKIDAEAEVSTITLGQGNVQPGEVLSGSESPRVEEVLIVQETTVETSTTVSEVVVSEIVSDLQDIPNSDTREQNGNLNTQLENDDCEPQEENQDLKPLQMDIMLDSSIPTNQVSEASPVLGFQVKSDSISTDSLSINETNELKDNIIADNVKLELEVVKEEIVETSVSNVVPDGGESHPMHDEGPHEESVEVKNKHNAINSDMGKENDTEDVGYSEKLNLDRSSGDDSMEEDVVDNKQIDSKYNSDEVDHKSAQTEVPVIKEEVPVDVATPTEKRKIHDQEAVGNSEASKRQRRWNTQSLTVPKAQSSSPALSTTPKDIFQSPGLKRNFSRSDSSKSEASPKERVVPPSSKPATKSLRIDRFVRPFTLKAVQELLGNTGNVTSFWMDHIKTHCYVTYSSVEEAIETRNAVYNLQWPPNGGLLLVAEFVDPQEVKMRVEPALQIPDSSVSTAPAVHPALPTLKPQPSPSPRQQVLRQPQPQPQPQPSPREQVLRQALPPPPSLPPPPPLSNPPPVRERLTLPPPPPLPENFDPPIVTLDDLFRKTKATPRIYYLPLSEELVAAKVADRDKNMKQ